MQAAVPHPVVMLVTVNTSLDSERRPGGGTVAVPRLADVACAGRAAAPGPGTFLLHELFCPTWQRWLQ